MILTREQGQAMVSEIYARTRAVACYYCTGFGKGKAALDAVKIEDYPLYGNDWGLIVCHSENARDKTWPQQVIDWLPVRDMKGPIQFCCYQSLKKHVNKRYKWVILDEAHYLTDNYYKYLQYIDYTGIVILTGTKPVNYKGGILNRLSKGNDLVISLDTAINNKILNDYRIRIWRVPITAAEQQDYNKHNDNLAFWKKTGNEFKIKQAASERARFIYNLKTKHKAACWLRDRLREAKRRFIIFCGSIEACNRISPYTMHSQTTKDDYNRFCNMEISELAAIKQIAEGDNINRLEAAIVQQINGQEYRFLQQLGRLMRLDQGETAMVHILVATGTVDEIWADKSIKSLDRKKITYHNIPVAELDVYN